MTNKKRMEFRCSCGTARPCEIHHWRLRVDKAGEIRKASILAAWKREATRSFYRLCWLLNIFLLSVLLWAVVGTISIPAFVAWPFFFLCLVGIGYCLARFIRI